MNKLQVSLGFSTAQFGLARKRRFAKGFLLYLLKNEKRIYRKAIFHLFCICHLSIFRTTRVTFHSGSHWDNRLIIINLCTDTLKVCPTPLLAKTPMCEL